MAVAEAEATRAAPRSETKGALAHRIAQFPIHFLLAFIALLWLIPAAGLFVTSILPKEVSGSTGWWHVFSKPSQVTWANYDSIFHNSAITHALWVTLLVTTGATFLPILIASLAGYALAWIDFPGRDYVFVTIVGLMVVPIQMALIPMFTIYNKLNLYDTVLGLILFHTAFALPFAVLLLRNFFAGIPRDLMEAARIDGASEWRIFFRLILPLGLPAIAALAIFQVLFVWNDFLVGLVLTQNNQPIAPAIAGQLRQFGSNLDVIAPASFFSAIVPLTIFALFQRYFVQGLLAGSVK